MKKITLTLCAIVFSIFLVCSAGMEHASAQFYTGGNMSFNVVGGFSLDLAPIAGYQYEKFKAGVSPVIMYTATGNTAGSFSYGGRVFAEYTISKGIFAHAEFGALNAGHIDWPTNGAAGIFKRSWVLSAPVGVGYEYEITKGVWVQAMVLYDALLDINLIQGSPLANPSVRGGINYSIH
jgi:hypothetical protein